MGLTAQKEVEQLSEMVVRNQINISEQKYSILKILCEVAGNRKYLTNTSKPTNDYVVLQIICL